MAVTAHRAPLTLIAVAFLLTLTACTSTVNGRLTGTPSGGGPSSGASGSSAGPSVAAADFHDCADQFNLSALGLPGSELDQFTVDCAGVSVPLDYGNPDGTHITVAIVRIHDTSVTPVGSLLVNPGGPGASGIELALGLIPQVKDTLLKHFDLIGFDPRGVGSSSPLNCLSDAQKDQLNASSPNVLTTAGFQLAKQNAEEIATACSSRYGSRLQYYNTVNTARDMDLIRRAVGDKQMNYLGFSYGTELGAQYIHLFPQTIRVAVLDGAVDPLTDSITSFADQLQGFEGAFDQFAANCRTTSSCSSLADPRAAVEKIVAAATAAPLTASGDSRKVTSSLVLTGVLQALYSQSLWPQLASALVSALQGNGAGLLSLADQYNERYNGQYTNIADANTTIGCNDSPPGPSDATIEATAKSWATRFPMFGVWGAAGLFSCQSWQPDRTVPPHPTAPSTPVKILVVGNTHDPATPYQGALDLAKTLGNAEVLTWNGEGHTSYLQGSSCVDADVNAYLIQQTPPPADTTCPR